MRLGTAARATVAACATIVLAGCSSLQTTVPVDDVGADAVHVVQSEGGPIGDPAHVRVVHVSSRPHSVTEWSVVGVDPASSTVAMQWVDGSGPRCGEVNHVEVRERSDSVTVGLADTARASNLNCAAVGVARHYDLHLQRPLGGRALLEPVTGVNDGLPHFDSGMPPLPTCSTNANPMDTPIGMADASAHMAPTSSVSAIVCRTAWPHGAARTTEVRVSRPADVRRIVVAINKSADPEPMTIPAPACDKRLPGAWYAVYLSGAQSQVEVFVDQINCGVVQNGALRATTTPRLDRELASLFAS